MTAPACFDDPSDWHEDDVMDDFCESCPVAYQYQMLGDRRCFPANAEVTPIHRLSARVPDAWNLRAILESIRVGFPSDKLEPWYRRVPA